MADTSAFTAPFQNQTQINPLAALGQMAGAANTIQNTRIQGQTFQGQKDTASALQQATDPQTGEVDENKFRSLIAQQPSNVNAPAAMQDSYTRAMTQLQQHGVILDNAQKTLGLLRNAIGAHMNDPNLSPDSIIKSAGDVMAASGGAITAQQVANYLYNPASPMPQGGDALRSWVQQKNNELLSAQERVGQLTTINDGMHQHLMRINPNGGVQNIADIKNDMAPGTPVYNGNSMRPQPYGVGDGAGSGSSNAPAVGGGGAIPAPSGAPAFAGMTEGGNAPQVPPISASALQAPAGGQGGAQNPQPTTNAGGTMPATGGASQPPSGSTGAGGIYLSAPPGAVEGENAAGADSGHASAQVFERAQGTPQRIFQLQQALKGLQNANTGPGTAETNSIKSFLVAQLPYAKDVLPDTVKSISSYDEANKYLTQYASSQAASLGAGTDEKLATALSGNASTHISNLAAQDVVKANIGIERMNLAQAALFADSGQPASNYNKWAVNWSKQVDPRAFMVDVMGPDKVKAMIAGMEPAEEKKFADTYRMAVSAGIMNRATRTPAAKNGGQ